MTPTTPQRHTTNIALSFALALATFLSAQQAKACITPPVSEYFFGDFGFGPPGIFVARTQEEWEALWVLSGRQDERPALNEDEQMAVGIFLGPRSTGGYRIDILGLKATETEGVAQLDYEVAEPDAVATQVLTTPYAIAILNRTSDSLIDETGREIDTPPAVMNKPKIHVP